MKIGKSLKNLRKEMGMTQSEIAVFIGISTSCYAGWEQDYREPDIDAIIKLCKIFGVSADYLLGLKDY